MARLSLAGGKAARVGASIARDRLAVDSGRYSLNNIYRMSLADIGPGHGGGRGPG